MRTRIFVPPAGRRFTVSIGQVNTDTKTQNKPFHRRKNQPKCVASECLPLVGSGASNPLRKVNRVPIY